MQSRKETLDSTSAVQAPPSVANDDVLAMLQVRESDALPAWLAERIARRHPGARQRILRVFPAAAARVKDLSEFEAFSVADSELGEKPQAIHIDEPLVQAVRSHRPLSVVRCKGEARLLAMLEAAGQVRYLIETAGNGCETEDSELAALATITGKYFERLVDAETDPLTRLSNRRVFHWHLEAGVKRWMASGRAYFLALLDLDRFKRINDNFGHLYGDEILVHFANLLRRGFRAGDLLYRFGGEEFVLLFGVDPGHRAETTLERFRSTVEGYHFPGVGRVTVSIGFTRIPDAATPTAILVERADEAVYYAKAHGRNKVCSWEALVESGAITPKAPPKKDVTLF